MSDRLRVREWSNEPPPVEGYYFIALRRAGNDVLRAARVYVTPRGELVGWRYQGKPTHWVPMIPLGGKGHDLAKG